MSKKSKSLSMSFSSPATKDSVSSPTSPQSPLTPSRYTLQPYSTRSDRQAEHAVASTAPTPPPQGSLPSLPGQPFNGARPSSSTNPSQVSLSGSSRRAPDTSSGRPFFQNHHASKSSSRLHVTDTIRKVSEGDLRHAGGANLGGLYMVRQGSGSTPDLSTTHSTEGFGEYSEQEDHSGSRVILRRPVGAPSRSEQSADARTTTPTGLRKSKPKAFSHLLSRSRSNRMDPNAPAPRTSDLTRPGEPEIRVQHEHNLEDAHGLKTAPLQGDRDRSFRDMMSSSIRHRSADRHAEGEQSGGVGPHRDGAQQPPPSFVSSLRESGGTGLFSNIKSSSTKAAGGLGKAGKGIFGKLTRSGSSSDNAVTDENYVCTTISLPLVQQTRRTRISKRLEHSKDKTEFWMPALPWRCIDYLNDRGCEEEGLYRIPGSGPKVKHWQRRFDTEYDVNLFDEPDLYDINIIGSMFKAWLRELPDEILPKDTQTRIARECLGATEVPQMLKDELSKLPPFNYYLLFAITCHLSLLHSYVDKNKMDYRNLCICFQPCLKIDGFCFQFLVCDWKHCWQGCWTEKEALEEEYRVLSGLPPTSAGGSSHQASQHDYPDERAISSSSSSKAPSTRKASPAPARKHEPIARKPSPAVRKASPSRPRRPSFERPSEGRSTEKHRPPPLKNIGGSNGGSHGGASSQAPTSPSTPKADGEGKRANGAQAQQLPELEPMVPLSPLGI